MSSQQFFREFFVGVKMYKHQSYPPPPSPVSDELKTNEKLDIK